MRLPDWKSRLSIELMAARKRAWKWSEHDCVTLGARCAEAETGKPFLARLAKFIYQNARSAAEFLKANSLRELIEQEIGPSISWVQCRHGDLVLCEHHDNDGLFREILTVHDGAQLLAPSSIGIKRIPFERAICGWRIE